MLARRINHVCWLMSVVVLSFLTNFVTSEDKVRVHMLEDEDYGEYWWYRGDASWSEAGRQCQQEGGQLATIKDAYIQDALILAFREEELNEEYGPSVWLGAHEGAEIGWSWLGKNHAAGISVQISHFPCAFMKIDDLERIKFIADIRCEAPKNYICGKPGCHGGSTCYRAFIESKTWQSARLGCQQEGMDLATFELYNVTSETEATHLEKLYQALKRNNVKGGYYWIGLVDKYWKWIDGDDVVYGSPWRKNSDESGRGDCMMMWRGGHWVKNNCNEKLKSFLCQMPVNNNMSHFGTVEILLSVLIPIIILLIVLLVVTFFIYNRRKKKSSEPPNESENYTQLRPFNISQSSERQNPECLHLNASIGQKNPAHKSNPKPSSRPTSAVPRLDKDGYLKPVKGLRPDNPAQSVVPIKPTYKSNPEECSRPSRSPPPAIPALDADGYLEPVKGLRPPSVGEAEYSIPYETAPPMFSRSHQVKPPKLTQKHQMEPQNTKLKEDHMYCSAD